MKYKKIRNKETFDMIFSFIKEGDSVLDIGCRNAELKYFLDIKNKKVDYFGIDPFLGKKDVYPCAINNVKEKEMETFKTSKKFDVIVLSHVLEHVKSPYLVLEKSKKLLRKSGKILLIVPNIYMFKFLCVIPFNLKNYPKGNETHLQEFTKMEISNLSRILGLKISRYQTRGFAFPLVLAPDSFQRVLSKIFPWLSDELFFILER